LLDFKQFDETYKTFDAVSWYFNIYRYCIL